MRIIDRKTFLSMPAGTVYSSAGRTYVSGDLAIKVSDAGYMENDWNYIDLTQDPMEDANVFLENFESKINGESFRTDYETMARDGLYDDNALFCIYDKQDIQKLINKLTELLK